MKNCPFHKGGCGNFLICSWDKFPHWLQEKPNWEDYLWCIWLFVKSAFLQDSAWYLKALFQAINILRQIFWIRRNQIGGIIFGAFGCWSICGCRSICICWWRFRKVQMEHSIKNVPIRSKFCIDLFVFMDRLIWLCTSILPWLYLYFCTCAF